MPFLFTLILSMVAFASIGEAAPPGGVVNPKLYPGNGTRFDLVEANPSAGAAIKITQISRLMKAVVAGELIVNTASNSEYKSIFASAAPKDKSLPNVFYVNTSDLLTVECVIFLAWKNSDADLDVLAPIPFTFIGVHLQKFGVAYLIKVDNRPNENVQRSSRAVPDVLYGYCEIDGNLVVKERYFSSLTKINPNPSAIGCDHGLSGYSRALVSSCGQTYGEVPEDTRKDGNYYGRTGRNIIMVSVNEVADVAEGRAYKGGRAFFITLLAYALFFLCLGFVFFGNRRK